MRLVCLNEVSEGMDAVVQAPMDGLQRPHLDALVLRTTVYFSTCPNAAPSFDFKL